MDFMEFENSSDWINAVIAHSIKKSNQINLKNLYSAPTIMDGSASQDNLGLKILKNIIKNNLINLK